MWANGEMNLSECEKELLRVLGEAWFAKPEGKRKYFHVGFEIASGDDDGTFLVHANLAGGELRVNHVELNRLVAKGIIKVHSEGLDQFIELTNRGESISRELILRDPLNLNSGLSDRSLSPSEPYGRLLLLRQHIRTAKSRLSWFEQHLPRKVLEVLYPEVLQLSPFSINLLSGEKHLNRGFQIDFKKFQDELVGKGFPKPMWRVLQKERARVIHGRFLFTDGGTWNLPPLNLILAGTEDEILRSEKLLSTFNEWWSDARSILELTLAPQGGY